MISILSRNLKAHALTVWKNTSMLMKPKIGGGGPCACNGFMKRMKRALKINLSDGFLLLIFVLDLRFIMYLYFKELLHLSIKLHGLKIFKFSFPK